MHDKKKTFYINMAVVWIAVFNNFPLQSLCFSYCHTYVRAAKKKV